LFVFPVLCPLYIQPVMPVIKTVIWSCFRWCYQS